MHRWPDRYKLMHDDKKIIKYGHTLLLLAARLRPFLGRFEAATTVSSLLEKLAIYVLSSGEGNFF